MIVQSDARRMPLADCSVQMIVTSPPYWGLRQYADNVAWIGGDAGCDHKPGAPRDSRPRAGLTGGTVTIDVATIPGDTCPKCGAQRIANGIGLEPTLEEYLAHMVEFGRECWRVLRDDGTLWLNMGDAYAANRTYQVTDSKWVDVGNTKGSSVPVGLKPKDLIGLPWRVAFALQADGWYLRQDIVWHKPNPMPESVRDRCTKAHEYLFLLTKNGGRPLLWRAKDTMEWSYSPDLSEVLVDEKGEESPRWRGFGYYYDAEAVREPAEYGRREWTDAGENLYARGASERRGHATVSGGDPSAGRNRRDVWTIPTAPYRGAHFATFPPALVEPCVLAGSPVGGIVLDPFCGSGTVGRVARKHGRRFVGLDLSWTYLHDLALVRAEGLTPPSALEQTPMFGGEK